MRDYRPPRKLAISGLNFFGRIYRALGGSKPRIEESFLLEHAVANSGLSDFGDDSFRTALRRLIEAIEEEAALTPTGRVVAQQEFLRLLENRLLLVDDRKRFPEIAAEDVRAPIFIVGMPRTGTTILHELLAQDPLNRVPLVWETSWPSPPPEEATYETDPRIALSARKLMAIDQLVPGFKKMHPMGAQLPEECVALMNHEFMSFYFLSLFRVPSYQDWFETQDPRPVYASHRRQLQHLQYRCPAKRGWVLKSPQHVWTLDALLDEYPDARIVHTHRDPVKVASSLASLVSLLRGMASDDVDPFEVGRDMSNRLDTGLRRSLEVRTDPNRNPKSFFDLHFRDFIVDPIAMVRRLYDHFELELRDSAVERMRAHLAANPSNRHGRHEYTLEGAGLDLESERARFMTYQEHFDIAPEL